jgi:hypothetical protein
MHRAAHTPAQGVHNLTVEVESSAGQEAAAKAAADAEEVLELEEARGDDENKDRMGKVDMTQVDNDAQVEEPQQAGEQKQAVPAMQRRRRTWKRTPLHGSPRSSP